MKSIHSPIDFGRNFVICPIRSRSDPSPPHSANTANLCSIIPQQSIDPTSYLSSPCNTHISNLEINTVGEDVVTKLLSELDHRTSIGHDGLPLKFLKICAPLLQTSYSHN